MSKTKFIKIMRNKNFLLIWFAQIISILGNWTYYVAITAMLYNITKSGVGIAKLRSTQTIVLLLLAPIVGVFVDRLNRRRIMIFSDLIRSFVLLFLLFFNGNVVIYIVGVTMSLLNSFFSSAQNSIIPDLVNKDDLVTANSLSSTTSNVMLICGGALGGLIVGAGGYTFAFVLDIITFLISAILLYFIKGHFKVQSSKTLPKDYSFQENILTAFRSFLNDISYCIKYLRKEKEIVAIILMFFLLSFGAGAINVLTIVFANQVLNIGSKGYGFLLTTQGLGSLLASIAMIFFNRHFKPVAIFNIGFLMMGLSMTFLGMSKNFIVAGILFFLSGFGNVMFLVPSISVMQKLIKSEVRGRVFSLQYMASESALLLGMLITGLLEGIVDIRIIISCGGLFETLGAIISILFFLTIIKDKSKSLELIKTNVNKEKV